MKFSLLLWALILIGTSFVEQIQADWQGLVRIQKDSKPFIDGRISGKGSWLRYDLQFLGQGLSAISNMETTETKLLLHPMKVATLANPDFIHAGFGCKGGAPLDCLKKHGFEKIGEEKVGNENCLVFAGQVKTGSKEFHQVKLWKPQGSLQEVPLIKSVTTLNSGQVFELEFTDIKQEKLAKDTFDVPKDYRMEKGVSIFTGLLGFGVQDSAPPAKTTSTKSKSSGKNQKNN